MDKILFAVAWYGIFTPLRWVSYLLNRLSLAIFFVGAWFISPWARLVRVADLPVDKEEA